MDGAQAVAHMPIVVEALDIDFFAFSGHKLFGPTGIGVLYGKQELLEQMPPYEGGGDMIKSVTMDNTTYQDLPLKFEAGTPPIVEVIGLGKAIEYVQSLGVEQIGLYENALLEYAREQLRTIPGLQEIGQAENKGAIFTFSIEGCHPLDVATFLDLEGICVRTGHLCCQPLLKKFGKEAFMRLSFAPYNRKEEVDVLKQVLYQTVSKLFA